MKDNISLAFVLGWITGMAFMALIICIIIDPIGQLKTRCYDLTRSPNEESLCKELFGEK